MAEHLVRKGEQKTSQTGGFSRAFLVVGVIALAIVLLLWIVLRRGTQDNIKFPSREVHHYVGSVGASVHMSILIDDATVTGKYYYDSQRKNGNSSSLILRGKRIGNRIIMTEFNNGNTTGWFEGNLTSVGYSGTFTRAKDGRVFDFSLVETGGGTGFFTESEIQF